jgi:autotransporter-associated beta strand protein
MTIYEDGLFNMNGGSNALSNLTLQGGHVTGSDATQSPLLTLTGNITTLASAQTAVIEKGEIGMSANGFVFNIADGAASTDLRVDSILHNGIGFTSGSSSNSLVKTGTGTLVLTALNADGGTDTGNDYSGVAEIQEGVFNIQHNNALGQDSVTVGSLNNGTVVDSGAQLQLESNGTSGDLTIGKETLSLSGTGISNTGALLNKAGDNTYNSYIYLDTDARINDDSGSSLTMSGNASTAGNDLDAGGAGNTTYSGALSGSGAVTKTDSGTVTFSGSSANTFTGGLNIDQGTVNFNQTAGTNALAANSTITIGDNSGSANTANLAIQANNQMPDSTDLVLNSDGRLQMGTAEDAVSQISGTGQIDLGASGKLIIGDDNSSSTFGGSITSDDINGTLEKNGSGTLELTSDISYAGTLELGGGTLKLSDIDLTVGALHITANTTLDFSGSSTFNVGDFTFANTSIVVNIINWNKNVDFFYSTNWAGATQDVLDNMGSKPESQVIFDGLGANNTGWDSYDDQIYPNVPEPSTYGLIFIALSTALVAFQRRRRKTQ